MSQESLEDRQGSKADVATVSGLLRDPGGTTPYYIVGL